MNFTEFQGCLKPLIGWKNHYNDAEIPPLDPTLNESESGQYFQDLHPACELDTISACLPAERDLNEYLDSVMNSAIAQSYNLVDQRRKTEGKAKDSILTGLLYNGQARFIDQVLNEGKFVGFMIDIEHHKGIGVKFPKIGFQQTSVQDVTFYVYHESQSAPLTTFQVQTQTANLPSWVDLNLELYSEDQLTLAGRYIIGYFQDDLTGSALSKNDFNFNTGPCGSCNKSSSQLWKQSRDFFKIYPISVPNDALNGTNLPDLSESVIEETNTFGMNLTFDLRCNLFEVYCQQRTSFTKIYGLFVVKKVLEDIKYNNELNRVEANIMQMVVRDLEGDKEFKAKTIEEQIKDALKATTFGFENVYSACMPCTENYQFNIGLL